jgi:transposase-like protein
MVFALVDREKGTVRSFHLPSVKAANLKPVLESQLMTKKTRFMTDGEGQYRILAPMFKSHEAVNHSGGEYVRGDAHTNTVEGYFSILKRGIIGTFHHVSPQHLQRYCGEFDFRYNNRERREKDENGFTVKDGLNDTERAEAVLQG